jgi:hypothetical protein
MSVEQSEEETRAVIQFSWLFQSGHSTRNHPLLLLKKRQPFCRVTEQTTHRILKIVISDKN